MQETFSLSIARTPDEMLLVAEDDGGLAISFFIDDGVIERCRGEAQLRDFLLVAEGVSHFVYLVFCAQEERAVRLVELETQAEVDKFLLLLFAARARHGSQHLGKRAETLHEQLFHNWHHDQGMNGEEEERYHIANLVAGRYCRHLIRHYILSRDAEGLIADARGFYRKSLADKLQASR
ncbi:MAG: hypothetical protein AAB932_02335 [Patescibacteria group bacterium]